MQRRIRCFIAVDVEDEMLRTRLVRVQELLRDTGAKLKLVEPSNLHITLRFIGEVSEGMVEEIASLLDKVSFKSFEMTVKGLGAFPRPSSPRVVWAGVERGAEELRMLAESVDSLLRRLGLRRDKEFRAHLTLARVKRSDRSGNLRRVISEYSDYVFGSQRVVRFKFKRSILTSAGPVYSDLAVYEAEDV